MIIRISHKEASERLNLNNTVQAKRSAVTENLHTTGVSERRDIVRIPIADSHFFVHSLVQTDMAAPYNRSAVRMLTSAAWKTVSRWLASSAAPCSPPAASEPSAPALHLFPCRSPRCSHAATGQSPSPLPDPQTTTPAPPPHRRNPNLSFRLLHHFRSRYFQNEKQYRN